MPTHGAVAILFGLFARNAIKTVDKINTNRDGRGRGWGWREAASGIDVVRLFETIKSGATENGARAQQKLVIYMVLDF